MRTANGGCTMCTCSPARVCSHCEGTCSCPISAHQWQMYDRKGNPNPRGRRIGCTCGWISEWPHFREQQIEFARHQREAEGAS